MYAKILNQLKKGNSSIMDYEKLLYDIFKWGGLPQRFLYNTAHKEHQKY